MIRPSGLTEERGKMDTGELRIEKVGRTWWLYEGDKLLAVTMYKVGSLTVAKRIEELKNIIQSYKANEGKEVQDGREEIQLRGDVESSFVKESGGIL